MKYILSISLVFILGSCKAQAKITYPKKVSIVWLQSGGVTWDGGYYISDAIYRFDVTFFQNVTISNHSEDGGIFHNAVWVKSNTGNLYLYEGSFSGGIKIYRVIELDSVFVKQNAR